LLVPADPGTTAAKVQSRLLSSKPLASDVAIVIKDLRFFLQPSEPADSVGAYDDSISNNGFSEETRRVKGDDSYFLRRPRDSGDEVENVSHPEEGQDDTGWESGTVGEDNVRESNSLDGGRSDSSDESSTTNSDSDSEGEVVSDDDLQVKVTGSHANIAKATNAYSTFLPSLSVGYIRGDPDDEDWSDSEAKFADTPQKKNRRGQRARRA
jgi:hypothetical protein